MQLSRSFAVASLAIGLAFPACSEAANHALIMWIADYASPPNRLIGVDLDAKAARGIAHAMNVPDENIIERSNAELTLTNMSAELNSLAGRIQEGDNVFLYYSGHGESLAPQGGTRKKCSEGMVSQDEQVFLDSNVREVLDRLSAKAHQVVMMNDSCFSGGAATKSLWRPGDPVPKAIAVPAAQASTDAQGVDCGDAVNKGVFSKNFVVVSTRPSHLLYIAASKDDEVSWATGDGSLATQAWIACISDPAADTDHSGSISGEELRACAQAHVDNNAIHRHQTISLTGTTTLPLSFPAPDVSGNAKSVRPERTLSDISAGADPTITVKLLPKAESMKIQQDDLDFTVQLDRPGYLYILQVGTDGTAINLLFPNNEDTENRLSAGTYQFPRPSWRLTSQGPAGTDYLLAVLSTQPRDFTRHMQSAGGFASAPSDGTTAKNLVVTAVGGGSAVAGRYGASRVVAIKEVP